MPSLSSLHLSSINNTEVTELLCLLESVIERDNDEDFIKAEADTFHVQSAEDFLDKNGSTELLDDLALQGTGIVDYTAITKRIVTHEKTLPPAKATPQFNHKLFYSSLKQYRRVERNAEDWGNILMYGEVVTSTNTLLEK